VFSVILNKKTPPYIKYLETDKMQ